MARKNTVNPPRKQVFRSLGLLQQLQEIVMEWAASYCARAVQHCREQGLLTERDRALMFDICVWKGSIPEWVRTQILADFDRPGQGFAP